MSKKNVYEVLDEFKQAKTKKERIDVLKNNESWALRNVLIGVFNPNVQFSVTKTPEFKREKIPAGMSYNNLTQVLDKIYLFQKDHPRVSPDLTEKRKIELLIQLLESLEEPEALVFMSILNKDLKVPYLTSALINEAFPGLLP